MSMTREKLWAATVGFQNSVQMLSTVVLQLTVLLAFASDPQLQSSTVLPAAPEGIYASNTVGSSLVELKNAY